jgi:hypothetical protein
VIRIKRVAEDIAAFAQPILAHLLGARLRVVATLAQRGEFIEMRKWIASALDWGAVIDDGSGLESADLKACLAKWVLAQFKPAQPLPSLRRVWPNCHVKNP